MSNFLIEKVLKIKSKGGNWDDLLYDDNFDFDIDIYDSILMELGISSETKESLIDEKIKDFFDSVVGDKND